MEHVKKSDAGFFTFPQHLDPRAVATGSEIDGTSAIVIGMVLLWERMRPLIRRERISMNFCINRPRHCAT